MERFDSVVGAVELTDERRRHIFQFHPEVRALRKHFADTLSQPDFMRRSRFDSKVFIVPNLRGILRAFSPSLWHHIFVSFQSAPFADVHVAQIGIHARRILCAFSAEWFIFYRATPQKRYLAIAIKTNQRNFILTVYLTNKIQHLSL